MKDNFFNAVKTECTKKKIIIICVLIAGILFSLAEAKQFNASRTYIGDHHVKKNTTKKERKHYAEHPEELIGIKNDIYKYNLKQVTDKKMDLKGDDCITQTFVAPDSLIRSANIVFCSPETQSVKGDVTVSLIDQNKKELAHSDLPGTMVRNGVPTYFDFMGRAEERNTNAIVKKRVSVEKVEGIPIKKGEVYTIKIQCKNISSKEEFGVYLCDEKYNDGMKFTYNGEQRNERIYGGPSCIHYTVAVIAICIFGDFLCILFVLLPIGYLNRRLSQRRKKPVDLNKIFSRLIFILTPFVAYFVVEKHMGYQTKKLFLEKMTTEDGLINLFIIALLLWIAYVCINRIKAPVIVLMSVAVVFAFTNFLLIQFRGSPLLGTDFQSFGTAMDVAASYTIVFKKGMMWSITAALVWICASFSTVSYPSLRGKKRLIPIAIMLVGLFGFYTLISSPHAVTRNKKVSGFYPTVSYKQHGSTLGFVMSIRQAIIEKPKGYSVEKAEEIAKQYPSDQAVSETTLSKKNPNVIGIMNESFSDLQAVGNFTTSEDYMPFYHSLKEDTIKGTMHVSIIGGGTANTEYEFLTGNTIFFLPSFIVPYNTNVHENEPSLAYTLVNQGYGGNISFHPGTHESYNRDVAYPYLGFKKFISQEELKDPRRIRAFISDEYDYEQLIKQHGNFRQKNSKQPFWMFNVTIQNHGGYKVANGEVKRYLTITDQNANEEEAEQYLNLMKESDNALKGLIEHYKNVDEPTVLVFFGDHQPRVGNDFYNAVLDHQAGIAAADDERKYRVPFMIWANYDIQEEDNVEISPNYLASYMLQKIGGRMTGYNKFLMDVYKKVPVITSKCYIGKDGVIHSRDDVDQMPEELKEYQIMQYNNVVDYKHRINDFFFLK